MAKRRNQPDETPRPRVSAAERRRQILAAARPLFRTRGYAALTHEAVAEAAGVKLASVLKHFPNKADLFAGLFDDFHAAAFPSEHAGPGADSLSFWLGLPGRFDKVAKAYRD